MHMYNFGEIAFLKKAVTKKNRVFDEPRVRLHLLSTLLAKAHRMIAGMERPAVHWVDRVTLSNTIGKRRKLIESM